MPAKILYERRDSVFYLENRKNEETPILIKVLKENSSGTAGLLQFENEYESTFSLHVQGIRKVLKKGTFEGRPALYFNYFPGESLHQAFVLGKQSLDNFLKTATMVAKVLGRIHAQHIIHKDISPSNILVDAGLNKVCIIDFGLATRFNLKVTYQGHTKSLTGSLPYMSPEQTGRTNRTVDFRSDLYALGVTFYEMLTGRLPFEARDPIEIVHQHIARQPTPPIQINPEIPSVLSAIVLKLMAKNPENRYQSAEGLHRDLLRCWEQWQEHASIEAFELGAHDFAIHFQLPEKLYGREKETAELIAAFDRACDGGVEMLMISGAAGVGKSALVREIHQPVSIRRGYFIEGKFEQFQRNIPYLAFSQAFDSWVQLLLSEPDDVLAMWRKRIQDKVGELGGVLTQLIPNLELLIGPQVAVPTLGPLESQNRFNYIFQQFIQAITGEEYPLVLFIDDLQWADGASLDLIRTIFTAPDIQKIQHILLIGAYRDNEVKATHPFRIFLNGLEKNQVPYKHLQLDNLKRRDVGLLIADALQVSLGEVSSLTDMVTNATDGNAFFVNEYLKNLYEKGQLRFNSNAQHWEWETTTLSIPEGDEGVVELIGQKIQQLAPATQEALKLAACIGNRFDLQSLAVIFKQDAQFTANTLGQAIQEGLITPVGNNYRMVETGIDQAEASRVAYLFQHDRIQQAVYQLIPKESRQALHRNIGILLLENTPFPEKSPQLFDIVNHLNEGFSYLGDPEKEQQLVRLNLAAGKKASQSAAYEPALKYMDTGIRFLSADKWKDDYELTLALYQGAAESAFLSGSLAEMEEYATEVLEKGESILDKMPVYNILVDAFTAQNRLKDAMNIGLEALRGLGVRFPQKPKTAHIIAHLMRTKAALFRKDIAALAHLPRMTDSLKSEAMPLLERMVPPAYMSGSALFPLLVFKMVNLSLRYGNSKLSPFGYASFAITLSGVLGDIESGKRFGKLSLNALKILDADNYKVKVFFVNYVFINHWFDHLQTCRQPLLDAYQSGLKVGNLVGATWSAFYYLEWSYLTGVSLSELEREMVTYSPIFLQLKQHAAYRRTEMLRQLVLNLAGHTKDPILFGGECYDDAEIESLSSKGDDETSLFFYHFNKLFLNYFYGKYAAASQHSKEAASHLEAVVGLPDIPFFFFYDALNQLALARKNEGLTKQKLVSTLRSRRKKMKKWARFAPMNYGHKYALMEAERYRLKKNSIQAELHYERAIEGARANGYIQEEALAWELAGDYYLESGKKELAVYYLSRAREAYFQWGAVVKVTKLEEDYGELLGQARQSPGERTKKKSRWSSIPSTISSISNLDVASAIKASNAISGEIMLEKLQATLLDIAMENSGANYGVLILVKDRQLRMVARKSAGDEKVSFLQDIPLQGTNLLCEPITNYVARIRKPLVVNDSLDDERFARDPYIKEKQTLSILCMPILQKGKLQGLLYLENDLIAGVFTNDRIDFLKILSSQMAISLENAVLYQNLSDALELQVTLTDAYSRFTPKEFLKFLGKDSILEVKLGDQRHGNMAILFSDIRSYTAISESMSVEENFKFINDYWKFITPPISRNEGVVNQFLGDGIMAFFPGASQAIQATLGMLQELKKYNLEMEKLGRKSVRMGMGIHLGPLMVGIIGDEVRMDTAIVSDTVNTASRLEGLTKYFHADLIVSESMLKELPNRDEFNYRFLGVVQLKGKQDPLPIYEIFDEDPPELVAYKKNSAALFEKGIQAYLEKDFENALDAFLASLELFPDDQVANDYLASIKRIKERGISEDWSGVMIMEGK